VGGEAGEEEEEEEEAAAAAAAAVGEGRFELAPPPLEAEPAPPLEGLRMP
jgi:hypothetical protein